MSINNRKNKAFTVAEVMITLVILSIICLLWIKDVQLKKEKYYNNFFSYSSLDNLVKSTDIILHEGCTSADVTNGVCTSEINNLPQVAYYAGERGFCNRMADLFNTIGPVICNPTEISGSTSNFVTYTPNFISSNGMKFYNFHVNPISNKYTVYVDIDGNQRDSVLNEDILEFIININGTMLPSPTSSIATNKEYLAASIRYYNSGYSWADEDVTYYKAVCDKYGNYDGVACSNSIYTSICSVHLCEIIVKKPSFFLLGF